MTAYQLLFSACWNKGRALFTTCSTSHESGTEFTFCCVIGSDLLMVYFIYIRADSRLEPSQWETSLQSNWHPANERGQSNAISHCPGTNLESALHILQVLAKYIQQSSDSEHNSWEALGWSHYVPLSISFSLLKLGKYELKCCIIKWPFEMGLSSWKQQIWQLLLFKMLDIICY